MYGDVDQTRYDLHFKIFDIPVRIHPFFWAAALLFSPFLGSQIHDMRNWLIGLAGWTAAWLLSFLVHEFGHALVLQRRYGAVPWIVLYGFGGMACHRPYYQRLPGTWGRILISFAGPGAELLSVAIMIGILLLCNVKLDVGMDTLGVIPIPMVVSTGLLETLAKTNSPVYYFLFFFVHSYLWMGIFWSILNLIPISPLDGGNMMREFLIRYDPRNGLVTSVWISILCAGALVFVFIRQGSFFAAIFFGFLAVQNYRFLPIARKW